MIRVTTDWWIRIEVEHGLSVDAFARDLAARIPIHARDGLWIWYVPASELIKLTTLVARHFPGHPFDVDFSPEADEEEGASPPPPEAPSSEPPPAASWARAGGFDSPSWWEQFFNDFAGRPPRRADGGAGDGDYYDPFTTFRRERRERSEEEKRTEERRWTPPGREGRAAPPGAPDPYAVLGVKPSATEAEIKRAYRRKAFEHHPDRAGTAEAFLAVQAAYETICNERGIR